MPEREFAMVEPARLRPGAAPAGMSMPRGANGVYLVGIGASAGGLEACKRFLPGLPAASGMAFILVQHMDPTHESLLVQLLGEVTPLKVVQAADGMLVEADHVYVIPPGVYLSVGGGALHLSPPVERAGARLPFDFFLNSLAAAGPHAVCVVLSGSGTDGSAGLRAIRAAGGLVIVQAPEEAGHDGMPRSAMATGLVDFVLPVAEIGEALLKHCRVTDKPLSQDGLAQIIELLRAQTPHDSAPTSPARWSAASCGA
jgi:two-component system CheB/CheR fusion protein